jgi:hypothetical protein
MREEEADLRGTAERARELLNQLGFSDEEIDRRLSEQNTAECPEVRNVPNRLPANK